jgi:hypothetical protein
MKCLRSKNRKKAMEIFCYEVFAKQKKKKTLLYTTRMDPHDQRIPLQVSNSVPAITMQRDW